MKDLILILMIIFLGAFILLYGIVFITERVALPGKIAQIEQLRLDAADVNALESEDIRGQVTVINQEISVNQTYNKIWWSSFMIPNRWDNVKTINIER